jgi:hypothetical protein
MTFIFDVNDVNAPSKSTLTSKKPRVKKMVFVYVLKVTNENQDPDPLVRSMDPRGSGSVPKLHGYATLRPGVLLLEHKRLP